MKIIDLPKITDERGGLSFIEGNNHIPFEIKRIYYLYDGKNKNRGNHAHKNLKQLIIAIHGSFTVELDDGKNKNDFVLNNPAKGLLITECVWRVLKNFSNDAVALILASEYYDESDYIRNYEEFLKYKDLHV